MTVAVNWTETALADLQAIEAYIARQSPQYGRAMVERIITAQRCYQSFHALERLFPSTTITSSANSSSTPIELFIASSTNVGSMSLQSFTAPAGCLAGFE
jgi:hypothetical protein